MESIGVLDKTILEIITHVKDLEEEWYAYNQKIKKWWCNDNFQKRI
jgi:hypothetical protein